MNRYEDEKKNILLSLRLLRRTDFTFLRYKTGHRFRRRRIVCYLRLSRTTDPMDREFKKSAWRHVSIKVYWIPKTSLWILQFHDEKSRNRSESFETSSPSQRRSIFIYIETYWSVKNKNVTVNAVHLASPDNKISLL